MISDRIVMLAIIAAFVVERLWGVPEPAPAKHEAKARRGPWKAWCVTTPPN